MVTTHPDVESDTATRRLSVRLTSGNPRCLVLDMGWQNLASAGRLDFARSELPDPHGERSERIAIAGDEEPGYAVPAVRNQRKGDHGAQQD